MKRTLLGILLTATVATFSTARCSSDSVPQYDVKSPLGIKVVLNGYSPNLPFLDQKFTAAADCLESLNYSIDRDKKVDTLLVEIVTAERKFPCEQSSTRYCAGLLFPISGARLYARAQLTQGLHAAAYESARHLIDDYGPKASEDVLKCGDGVDHLLGHR